MNPLQACAALQRRHCLTADMHFTGLTIASNKPNREFVAHEQQAKTKPRSFFALLLFGLLCRRRCIFHPLRDCIRTA
jgi:hypothetical protein